MQARRWLLTAIAVLFFLDAARAVSQEIIDHPLVLLNAEARVKSNTQVALPSNLFLGDMNGDGIDDFIQVSGSAGAGNHNRILVFGTDRASTGIMHVYLDTDVVKAFTGNFQLASEASYGPDQLCVTTASGLLNCYMSKDGVTLTLFSSQPNFIDAGEDIVVGDFDGNGADDFLLYDASAGTFRLATRTSGTTPSSTFFVMPNFSPGDLSSGTLVNWQLRAGQWCKVPSFPGADSLIAYNPTSGAVALFDLGTGNPANAKVRSFSTVFNWNDTSLAGSETLSTGRLVNGTTDSLVFRNTGTGAYRFLNAVPQQPQLTAVPGLSAGALPVEAHKGQLVFARLNLGFNGAVRDDSLFFNASPGQFVSTEASGDAATQNNTYQQAFNLQTSTRDEGWAAVEHDQWLCLCCKFADYPNVEDPLFTPDTYIQNEFGRNGIGMGGFVDFFSEISYGQIDYNMVLAPGWYATVPTTQYSRYAANSTCAINYGHGITAASFKAPNYIGPTYGGIIALWNKQHDAGNDTGNLTVLDSGIVGTDMSGSAHEALHAYGLAHPHTDQDVGFCGGASTEYCNIWDPMGGSQIFTPNISTYELPANNPGMAASVLPPRALDGIEINAANRIELNVMPLPRVMTLTPQANNLGKQQATVTIAALEKPEANGYLVLKILGCDPGGKPVCGDQTHFYTVELRVKAGWDIKISQPTVLINEVFAPRAVYTPGKPAVSWWQEFLKTRTVTNPSGPGQIFLPGEFLAGTSASYAASTTHYPDPVTTPPTQVADGSSPITIAVQSFDSIASTATVLVTY